jgi:hypothetical protein
VTRSPKILIPAVAAVAAIAAFYFLALAPKQKEAARLDSDIAAKRSELQQSRDLAEAYERARANYKTNYRTVARLGKAVPADDDVRSLLVQLDDAAKRSKVDFQSISVGAGGASAAPGATTPGATTASGLAPAPGTVPVGSAGFSAMPFSFGFEGSFFRLSDFFNRVEDFVTVENDKLDVTGRLLMLGSISVAVENDLKNMKAQIGAASYLVPPAEGIEGAEPASPAGSTQDAAPPAGGASAPPTTSATITGVR